MQENRVLVGHGHHLGIDLPIGEGLDPRFVFGLKAHRRPYVGGDDIGTTRSIHRIGKLLEVIGTVETGHFRLHFVARRGRHIHVEVEHLGGLQPGIAHIV